MLVRLRWRRRDVEMCLDWMYMTDGMGGIGAFLLCLLLLLVFLLRFWCGCFWVGRDKIPDTVPRIVMLCLIFFSLRNMYR
jgi:hypothetical protein